MNITDLIKKYEQMRFMNKRFYFDADEFVMIANYYIEKNKILDAQNVISIGLRMHPNSTDLMVAKGKVLVDSKKYETAYNYLLTIAIDETNVDLLLLKIQCLLKLNRVAESNSYLAYIIEGDLDKETLHTFLKEVAYLYNDAEVFTTAIEVLKKALEINNTDIEALTELAYAYEMSNEDEIDNAIATTNAIIDIDPYSFDAWVTLGRLHLYNSEHELSIDAYDFALAIRESDLNVLKLKAITYSEGFDYENELKVLSECLDVSPVDENFYNTLLEKYREFEEYWGEDQDEAVLNVLEKRELQFGREDALLEMAQLNVRLGRTEKAMEICEAIPEEEKQSVDYYKLEGDIALQNKDEKTAEALYLIALKESPNDVEILDTLAEIYLELDQYEKSAEFLERLLAVNPNYGLIKFRLAHVRFDVGDQESFNDIINQITDKQQLEVLYSLFARLISKEKIDYHQLSRDELLTNLNKAREKHIELKNI